MKYIFTLFLSTLMGFSQTHVYEPLAIVSVVKKSSSEMQFWDYVNKENSIAYYQAYIKKYPDGIFLAVAQNKIQQISQAKREKKEAEKNKAHIGIGGGILGLEMWVRRQEFSYGFAVKSTANLETIESAAFVNYHLNEKRDGSYLSFSFGYQYLESIRDFTPGVGLGVGYRSVFLDLIYIDYGIKLLVNNEYITSSFHTFTGFEF